MRPTIHYHSIHYQETFELHVGSTILPSDGCETERRGATQEHKSFCLQGQNSIHPTRFRTGTASYELWRGAGGGGGREGKLLLCGTELKIFLVPVLTPNLRCIDIYAKPLSKCSLIFTLYLHIWIQLDLMSKLSFSLCIYRIHTGSPY